MTKTSIELTEDAFEAIFPTIPNPINPNVGWPGDDGRGCLFETYGEQLAFVRRQNPRTVWTLVDGDDGNQLLASGDHLVNRVGYLVSAVPVPEGVAIQVPFAATEHDQD